MRERKTEFEKEKDKARARERESENVRERESTRAIQRGCRVWLFHHRHLQICVYLCIFAYKVCILRICIHVVACVRVSVCVCVCVCV